MSDIKVGSKVRIADSVEYFDAVKPGDIRTVVSIEGDGGWLNVEASGYSAGFPMRPDELELVLVERVPQVGDRIYGVANDGEKKYGVLIEPYEHSLYPFRANFDGQGYNECPLYREEFSVIEPFAVPERKDWTDLIDRTDELLAAYKVLYNHDVDDNLTIVTRELRDALIEESYR